jgi:DNA-binding NarL/FixJ family response regulator
MDTKSKQFQKLKTTYYKKLKDEGFVDIETQGEDGLLEKSIRPKRRGIAESVSRLDFYRCASDYLFNGEFKSVRDWVIWAGFVEGKSVRVIAAALNLSKSAVDRAINKYLKKAKLKR